MIVWGFNCETPFIQHLVPQRSVDGADYYVITARHKFARNAPKAKPHIFERRNSLPRLCRPPGFTIEAKYYCIRKQIKRQSTHRKDSIKAPTYWKATCHVYHSTEVHLHKRESWVRSVPCGVMLAPNNLYTLAFWSIMTKSSTEPLILFVA